MKILVDSAVLLAPLLWGCADDHTDQPTDDAGVDKTWEVVTP